MNKAIKHKITLTLFISCASIILIFSLFISVPKITDVSFSDKIEHTAAYFILGFLFVLSFKNKNRVVLNSIIICTLYGGLIEVLQAFTGRHPELLDILADFSGAVIGSVISWYARVFFSK
jgi:VanZ family protein